jgi:hypothetical protein
VQNSDVENLISDHIAAASFELLFDPEPRTHLGISIIGEECERALVYGFRWINREIFSPRMLRLFERGQLEEARLVRWLRWKGWNVEEEDPATGKQFAISAINGHFGSAIDGKASHPLIGDEKFLLEFKTIATGPFGTLTKEGVKKFRPKHWAQMCAYGWFYNLPRAIYLTVNKNDDAVNPEVVTLDFAHGQAMFTKAARVIGAVSLPPRISDSPAFFKCKICAFEENCHKQLPHAPNCRSCTHALAVEGKQWACKLHNAIIPQGTIKTGCPDWKAF